MLGRTSMRFALAGCTLCQLYFLGMTCDSREVMITIGWTSRPVRGSWAPQDAPTPDDVHRTGVPAPWSRRSGMDSDAASESAQPLRITYWDSAPPAVSAQTKLMMRSDPPPSDLVI
jgi:hypothetical protein